MEIWSLGLFFLENSGLPISGTKSLVPGLKFSRTVFSVTIKSSYIQSHGFTVHITRCNTIMTK